MSQAITRTLLSNLFVGFKTSFQGGFAGVAPLWSRIATPVPSSTDSEEYGWLGSWPAIREWLGDRVINELSASQYTVRNRDFETTVGVKANHIKDDKLGIYGPMFTELGRAVGVFPDQLIFTLLALGAVSKCYDGQYFFDTDHPVGAGVVSNDGGGGGAAWYLMDTSRALKPLIYQEREKFDFTALDNATDENVFMRKEYLYGSQGRANAGFGFWQMAYRSKQELNADNYEAARAAMMAFTDDSGRLLGIKPDVLVAPGSLEGKALRLLKNPDLPAGGTNEWAGTAEPLISRYL